MSKVNTTGVPVAQKLSFAASCAASAVVFFGDPDSPHLESIGCFVLMAANGNLHGALNEAANSGAASVSAKRMLFFMPKDSRRDGKSIPRIEIRGCRRP